MMMSRDPDSRIMKRAGGGFDASYIAQTGVDDTAHIIGRCDRAIRRAATRVDQFRGLGSILPTTLPGSDT